MTTKNDGGPAFPTVDANRAEDYGTYGMTIRDYFAGKAMAGPAVFNDEGFKRTPEELAALAYQIADAMLAARSAS